ncbi:major royal jelly protein, partial [Metarhizium hybridum]
MGNRTMSLATWALSLAWAATAERQVLTDPGIYGPPLEIAHYYMGQMPTGIAVSRESRLFSTYPACLDANNTNTIQTPYKFQVAELMPDGSEVPYPSVEINTPPGGALNMSTNPPTSANYADYFIGCQSVVVDNKNVLYILDAGRAIDPQTSVLLNAVPGGPKIVSVDLSTNEIIRTYTFPGSVVYGDSFLNDIRVDRTPGLSGLSGGGEEGVAYITDSSFEGRNGLVILDLTSGESWRHLDNDPRLRPQQQFLPFVHGSPVMFGSSNQYSRATVGSDGIALSADGKDLYFSVISGRELWSVPTAALRARDAHSELLVQASVSAKGQKGVGDGMETDSNGIIYTGHVEQEAIVSYAPGNATVQTLLRDPRINWVDTLSVGWDGSLYFTVNQVHLMPGFYPGTERRQHPYVLFKAQLPDGGKKVGT